MSAVQTVSLTAMFVHHHWLQPELAEIREIRPLDTALHAGTTETMPMESQLGCFVVVDTQI